MTRSIDGWRYTAMTGGWRFQTVAQPPTEPHDMTRRLLVTAQILQRSRSDADPLPVSVFDLPPTPTPMLAALVTQNTVLSS